MERRAEEIVEERVVEANFNKCDLPYDMCCALLLLRIRSSVVKSETF